MGEEDPNVWNLVIDLTPGDEPAGVRAIGLALACIYDVFLTIRDQQAELIEAVKSLKPIPRDVIPLDSEPL